MTTYLRAPAFVDLADLLSWSQRHGQKPPAVYQGPDGSYRGSVEAGRKDAEDHADEPYRQRRDKMGP